MSRLIWWLRGRREEEGEREQRQKIVKRECGNERRGGRREREREREGGKDQGRKMERRECEVRQKYSEQDRR